MNTYTLPELDRLTTDYPLVLLPDILRTLAQWLEDNPDRLAMLSLNTWADGTFTVTLVEKEDAGEQLDSRETC